MHSGGKYDIASLEFLVRLADEDAVWLHSSDVSEDLRRDYEISWWKTCREVSLLGKIFVTLLSNAFREETPPRIIWRREAKF